MNPRRLAGTLWQRIGDLLVPGIVFVLASILATNQGGLADSMLGVLSVMVASGLGVLACVTATRRPARFALTIAGLLAAGGLATGTSGRLLHFERSYFGVVRVTHDAERNRAPTVPRQHAARAAEPRCCAAARAVDLLHAIGADRPGV